MQGVNNYTGTDLTFVVCAYKECRYLEECIKSLVNQTVKAKQILVSTSTPNEHIQKVVNKYGLELKVNKEGGQVKDYNFAIKQANTKLVMLAHQDDILSTAFVENVLEAINCSYKPIIAFTNYKEMHDDVLDKKDSGLVKIKRIMLWPLKFAALGKKGWGKRIIQIFGNPITHPTVVCVKDEMPELVFDERFKAAMDWDLWERLSKQKGSFVYVPKVLLYHRMNDENQTVKILKGTNERYNEEYEVMSRIWPSFIARIIMHFYEKNAKYY